MLASGGLEGCFFFRGRGHELPVEVRVASDVNDDSPVPVSFVVVHDQALLQELSKLTAVQWLKMREQYLLDHAGVVQERYFELVPGPSIHYLRIPARRGAAGGILFIGYHAEGFHRHSFDPKHPVWLELSDHEARLRQE